MSVFDKRIVVLISGSGTNLQALLDAQNSPSLPGRIVLVVSNRKAAYGLTRASSVGIPTAYLALSPYLKAHPGSSRDDYDVAVAKIVSAAEPDLVVLAGWMHVFRDGFLEAMIRPGKSYAVPVINLHPALPGAFDGAHAIERAYEAFAKGETTKTGVMVHRVVREVDRGEPIIVREIEMKAGEPLEELEERIHKVEWEIIVQGARKVLEEDPRS